MGDDGHFIASAIYCFPVVLLITFCISRIKLGNSISIAVLVFPAVIAMGVVIMWSGQILDTTIAGNHLCGRGYNDYIVGGYLFERFVPLVHLVLGFSLIAVCTLRINSYRRAKNA